MLQRLASRLSSQMTVCAQHTGTRMGLEQLEATLFCIAAVHEAVPEDEVSPLDQLYAGQFFATINSFEGSGGIRLKRTLYWLIGEYWAVWSRVA